MKQFIHDWIHLTQGEMFIKYWHLWLLMLLIVLLILVVIVWWHDDIFKQNKDNQWQDGGFTTSRSMENKEPLYQPIHRSKKISEEKIMTQYIKRVNTIEAIQNKGKILTDVIPFLNEHGIAFEYTDSFIEGKRISVMISKGEYTTLKIDDYLVINKSVISIMNAKEFESKYQEDDSVGRKNINTELSTNITLDKTQPHIHIEFDDIRDVPKVWVDGELMDDGANDKSLVSLKVDWNTDTATENHKGFDINYYDLTGERPMRRGIREGTPR
ncbi:hypothetical protein [Leuconostoc mesenteroides]|uniref:hypothetical protein n=1 Tax=Leuconostoc mesenteroides TaxID=1245 RepID=UPI0020784C83|nr:hypothetical protein [Leuconostoc mesenteroides]USI45480.1 hypothetical protein M0D19_08270 [Leuconostoc mesenteroides]